MIALLFGWTLLLFTAYTYGIICLRTLGRIWGANRTWNLLDVTLIGTGFLASILNVFHVFVPADTNLMFIVLLMGLIYWFFDYKKLFAEGQRGFDFIMNLSKKYWLLFIFLIFLIAMFCSLYPRMTDTLYYHYQNLLWNNAYPTVPGLGNLQPRFGFNSNIYLLTSTFGLYAIFNQFIFSVHTLFLAMITVWIMNKAISGKANLRKLLAVAMFISFFVIYKIHITSVTSDFFANLLVLYLFLNIILDHNIVQRKSFLYLIVPLFIVTIKLSCAPIVIFSFVALFYNIKNKGRVFLSVFGLIFTGCYILIPWCYNTYILTGYLFFPLPYFDFFNPDWKIPMHYLMEQKEFIQAFAKYPNNLDIKSILSMSITDWFPVWWRSDMFYYNPLANRFFFFVIILGIPVGGIAYLMNKRKNGVLFLSWVISILAIILWFFNAPDFRFVYAFILNLFFLSVIFVVPVIRSYTKFNKINIRFYYSVLALYIIFVAFFSFRWIYYQKGNTVTFGELINKPTSISYKKDLDYAQIPVEDTSNGFTIYRRSYSDEALLCYDYPLPSSADFVGGIEMRGKSIEEGFRCRENAKKRLTY